MSTRIESGNPMQIFVDGPSQVIVIPKKQGQDNIIERERKIPSERWQVARHIPTSLIREATQDIINFGQDSEDLSADSRLTSSMIKARRNKITFEQFNAYFIQDFIDMKNQLGYNEPKLEEAKERITAKAENIWTAKESELTEILQGLHISSHQKS